jgi:biopolymer transport protein ExbB
MSAIGKERVANAHTHFLTPGTQVPGVFCFRLDICSHERKFVDASNLHELTFVATSLKPIFPLASVGSGRYVPLSHQRPHRPMIDKIVHFFSVGGVFMIPLILVSIVSLAFILERGIALRRSLILPEALLNALSRLRIGGSTSEIEHHVAPGQTTLARLVRIGLEHLPWSKSENMEAIQTQARTEISRMERGLVVLEISTGIGPLLGLLGTVSGLVAIFANIGSGSIATQGVMIAKGISEALNTTVVGLVVAIPSLIAHSYYSKKIEAMSAEMESACMDLLTKLYLKPEEGPSEPRSGG